MLVCVAVLTTNTRSASFIACIDGITALECPEGAVMRTLVVQNGRETADHAAVALQENAVQAAVVDVIVEPRKGIPFARNTALRWAIDAGVTHLAFIDDDARPDPDWLVALLRAMSSASAEAASGPQVPVFPEDAPAHLRNAEIYRERRLACGARCAWAATNNVVFSTVFAQAHKIWFNEALRTGGSDKEFFLRLTRAGGTIVWAPDAIVREPVIPERLSTRWAARRAYRYGSTGFSIESAIHPPREAVLVCMGKGGYYILSGLIRLPAAIAPRHAFWVDGLCRIAHGVGFLLGMSPAFRLKRYT